MILYFISICYNLDIMNKYVSKFLSIFNHFKDNLAIFENENNFKTKANTTNDALKDGDFDTFVKHFIPTNPFASFCEYGVTLAINGSYDLFLKVEKFGIENNVIDQKFYNNIFDWSFSRDNHEIVKYLTDKNHFSVFNIDDKLFKTIVENDAKNLLMFTLYDLNYQPSKDIVKWLEIASHTEIIDKIQKRDLLFELNSMKSNDNPPYKKSRVKI